MTIDSGVYKIVNKINGNCYVGSSKSIDGRLKIHLRRLRNGSHRNPHLQSAFKKYGESAFDFIKVLYCDLKNLLIYEQLLLDEINPEYNICPNAGNTLGVTHSKETRKKMSNARKGKKFTEEHKKKISIALKGHAPTLDCHSQKTRKKISESLLGHSISSETRKKISESNKGKHFGSYNGMWGRKHTEETKRKISQSMKRYHKSISS
ncbi:MAG: NUMOD3 domain-containing DNA-binding protein [Chloroflexota bacterium]|nr:NUMOD3 domain-containing DNA-binding protein [Chloroflexota bacterium]